jgi:septal ring factor EnvC (AmiA/AmiB activator)
MKKLFYLFTFIAFLPVFLLAQDEKSQLEKERQEIQNEIRQIDGELTKVKGKTRQIVGQYNLIDRKIKLQNRYIANISKEIRFIDDDIYLSNVEIYRLGKLLDTLKAQYARSVVYAYKNRSNYDYLNFIFSASSFNDAIKRITYLKSYRAYREQQVNTIKETQALIARRKEEQLSRKRQKDGALKNQTVQAQELEGQKKEKDVVLKQLKSQEKDLQKQLNAKKKRMKEINRAVDAIVKRLIAEEKKKEEERKRLAANNTTSVNPNSPNVTTPAKTVKTESFLELNAEAKALGASFENNRAKLPWPVDQGYVCEHYGPFKIEKIQGVNPGITICTPQPGANVKAVFDGEVVSVFNIDDTKSVMIRHGKYFTVYSNLTSVSVSKGSDVRTNQSIGKVAADEDDGAGGKLEFLLMQENKNLNPELWLRK